MIVKVEQDPDDPNNVIVPLPEELVGKFNLKEGDTAHITHQENGYIEVRFTRELGDIAVEKHN